MHVFNLFLIRIKKKVIVDILGSRFLFPIGKDFSFGMFKLDTTLEKN